MNFRVFSKFKVAYRTKIQYSYKEPLARKIPIPRHYNICVVKSRSERMSLIIIIQYTYNPWLFCMLGSSPLSNNIFATATKRSAESSEVASGEDEAIKCNTVSPRSGVTIEMEAPRSSKNFAATPSPINDSITDNNMY